MVEAHARAELDHSRGFAGRQRVDRNAQLCRRAEEQRGVADRFGRRDEQQLLGLRQGGLDATDEALLDRCRRRPPARDPEPAGQLGRGDASRHLEDGQRNAARLGDDAVSHLRVDSAQHDRFQQLARIGVGQALDLELRQPGQHRRGASRTAKTSGDRLGQQPPGDEAERLHRHLVEPLRVVDDAEQRLVVGGGGHQAQHGQPDQETVRGLPGAAAERDVQRLALRFRQFIEVVHQRRAQLLQPGECELHVGLHAGHLHDAESRTPALRRSSSSAVLPTPASPRSTSTWQLPDRAVDIRP